MDATGTVSTVVEMELMGTTLNNTGSNSFHVLLIDLPRL